jgi:hypothetical protein
MCKTKYKILNHLVKLTILLFIGSWLDDIAQLESLNENKNEIPLEKESLYDYLNENKYKIFGVSCIIIFISLIYFNNTNTSEKPFIFPEVFVPPLDLILSSLQPYVLDIFYNDFLSIVSDVIDKKMSKEEGVIILLKMMNLKKNKTLVFDEKEFQQITEKLLEEIEKL